MRLSASVVAAYVSVAFTAELMGTFWGLYALHSMTDNAGLDPLYTGIVIVIYRIWDAINDVWFGYMSDTTVSARWGKRRGWMLAGALPYTLAYITFWYVPFSGRFEFSNSVEINHFEQQILLSLWNLFLLCVIDAGFSAVNMAWFALLGDLTESPEEKFSASLWRSILAGFASLLSVALVGVFSYEPVEEKLFGGEHLLGWVYLAVIYSVVYLLSVLWCVYATAGISVTSYRQPITHPTGIWHFVTTFKRLLLLREVRLLVIIFVSVMTALQFSVACLAYFFLNVLETTEFTMAMVILTALGTATVTGVMVKTLFAKYEKQSILGHGLVVWMIFYVLLALIQSPDWYMYPAACLMGIGLGLSLTIPTAMVTDTADVVEHQLGERHDGILIGMQWFFNKVFLGIMTMGFQFALEFTGFQKGEPVSVASEWAIRLGLVMPVPALMVAYWANGQSALNSSRLKEIAADLIQKRSPRELVEDFRNKREMSTYAEFRLWFFKRTQECNLMAGSMFAGNEDVFISQETYDWAESELKRFMEMAVEYPYYRLRVVQPWISQCGFVCINHSFISADYWPVQIINGKLQSISSKQSEFITPAFRNRSEWHAQREVV